MMRSVESASSVFYHSQEEESLKMGGDTLGSGDVLAGPPYDSYHNSTVDSSPVSREADPSGTCQSFGPNIQTQNLNEA